MKQNRTKTSYRPEEGIAKGCLYRIDHVALTIRFGGIIPVLRLPVKQIQSMRLATPDDYPVLIRAFSWLGFVFGQHHSRPTYLLKTNTRKKIIIALPGNLHFKLRQVIGKNKSAGYSKLHKLAPLARDKGTQQPDFAI